MPNMAVRANRAGRVREGDIVARRYRIEQLIAQGGIADVYRAADHLGQRKVALKLLRVIAMHGDVNFKRFQREAMLLQKVDHPNVVRTFHYGLTERGGPFIAFELLEGMSLKGHLSDRGPLDLHHTVHVARQILLALETAHAHQIVHRDIKPSNVLLSPDFSVKLIDFGLAKSVGVSKMTKLTEKGMAVGTPRYMAPEQVKGQAVSELVDLYPVGLVIAEMLTGEPLVGGTRTGDIIRIHGSREPLMLPRRLRDTPLANLITRAIAKTPEDRFASAAAMRAALEAAVA